MGQLPPGTRVKLSALGIERKIRPNSHPDRQATVSTVTTSLSACTWVLWDGNKQPDLIADDYITTVEEPEATMAEPLTYNTKTVMRVMPIMNGVIPLPDPTWWEADISEDLPANAIGKTLADAMRHLRKHLGEGFNPVKLSIEFRVTFYEAPETYTTNSLDNRTQFEGFAVWR